MKNKSSLLTLLTLSSGTITSLFVERPIVPPGHVIKNSLPTNELQALDSVTIIRIHGGHPTTSITIQNKHFKLIKDLRLIFHYKNIIIQLRTKTLLFT